MNRRCVIWVCAVVFLSTVIVPSSYAGSTDVQDDTEFAAMVVDAMVARPAGVVTLGIGFVVFSISSPFSAWGGNIGHAWDALVVQPAKATFVRPLGEFN